VALVAMDKGKGSELLPTCLARTQDSLVGLVSPVALVVRDNGGEQHMGEKGKDGEVALCLLDGDSPLGIYPPLW
jgi:hypothetical protein